MQKEYIKPTVKVVQLQDMTMLMQASNVSNNADINETIGTGSDQARVKTYGYSVWDDDWQNP